MLISRSIAFPDYTFVADIDNPRPFIVNNEASSITFWDGETDIGYINEIDKELLNYY